MRQTQEQRNRVRRACAVGALCVLCALPAAGAPSAPPMLGGRLDFDVSELPQGRLTRDIDRLVPTARLRAQQWLRRFSFPSQDVNFLAADAEGGIYYVDTFLPAEVPAEPGPAEITLDASPLAVSPFPDALKFHSKPGSQNVLFIDFDGHAVSGTAWNASLGRDPIPAVAFSMDADRTTFSVDEQTVIKRVWQRVAEDYAPFDIDVTTEAPASFGTRTAHALVTRNTDANGHANPSSDAGGIAYVDVFADGDNGYYSPAWIYNNNLSDREYYISEAISHEIGHNMGLSHDGTTDGVAYYDGHGSGDVSWGTLMGVSYALNVSQWSRGEYYHANNNEDDMARIAAKTQYRADDHGDSAATASSLTVTGGQYVVATTPETDVHNDNPANKGFIETDADVDMFSFRSGAGDIYLAVSPWLSPASYRGGNLDVRARLYDAGGALIAENDPADHTYAAVAATVTEGIYYLQVAGVGTGSPLSASPSGYTSYGSVGQYFITGLVVEAVGPGVPPQAALTAVDIELPQAGAHTLTLTYTDDLAVDVASLDDLDVRVTGPDGYDRAAVFVSVDYPVPGTPRVATYSVEAPGGDWGAEDNGAYQVWVQADEVGDIDGAFVAAQEVGSFQCDVPALVYQADMTLDPGWTLDTPWAYGQPTGVLGDPSAGYNGDCVVGCSLNGAYARKQAMIYATTPAIDCTGAERVVLQFRRWLGLAGGDTAVLEASNDGSTWVEIWSSQGIMDYGWTLRQYDISNVAASQSVVYVRWGIGSDTDFRVTYGWSIDEVEVLASGQEAGPPPEWTVSVSVNHPGWGTVTPSSGAFLDGMEVALVAVPSNYYAFVEWRGDAAGVTNPLVLQVETNMAVQAVFAEVLTTNYPTPHWWLAEQGCTGDFEQAVSLLGDNGCALWESYVAGLDPGDPQDTFGLTTQRAGQGDVAVEWSSVSGRLYTVSLSTNLMTGFTPLPDATDLSWPRNSYTSSAAGFFRLSVRVAP